MTPAKGYTEMKDSGIQWIGEVPVHWEITRMKSILENVSIRNHPEAEVLSLYRDLGVLPKNSRDDNHNVTSEDTAQYKYVEVGNLVINKMKAWQGSLAVSNYEGIVSPAYYVCKFRSSKINKRYIHFLVRCYAYAQEFERLSTGMRVGQWDLGISDFMRVPALLPPFPEQSAIAAYLDTQCAKIDEIIAQAKASIEDYKQWKASIIYEAVTKGLDPNVEMKDSGIEWIGKVPMRWKIVRLKYLLSTPLQYGANETGLPYDESLPRYIRITDITLDGKLKTSGMQSLSEEKSEGYILDDEDILLARSGATVGKAFYYRESYGKAAFAGYLIRAKINSAKALPKFIYYSTMSAGYEKWKETAVIKATIQNIGASRYNEYSLAIPPIAEQLRIIEFLDDKMEKIDSLMAEKQSLIDDLESYKKSLIYEVVTGKRRA